MIIKTKFQIQQDVFDLTIDSNLDIFRVDSKPRPYTVEFINDNKFTWINSLMQDQKHPLILIDKNVKNICLNTVNFGNINVYEVDAVEDNKNINKVLHICNWLLEQNANRGSHLFVIGGGILQDLGAFSSYMFKRGIPWTFIPTTLLAQADSCLGGKTAVNHGNSKNVLGLFSAPRRVFIDINFLESLRLSDYLSGAGEIFRLLATAGDNCIELLENSIDSFLVKDKTTIKNLISSSLQVKKAIVENDEFELDIRRSMNYGHSLGHALEALSNYYIPHGQAVSLGMIIENQLSTDRHLLSEHLNKRINILGKRLISDYIQMFIKNLPLENLMTFLTNDKKAEGNTLKIATLTASNLMEFISLNLDDNGLSEILSSIKKAVA